MSVRSGGSSERFSKADESLLDRPSASVERFLSLE